MFRSRKRCFETLEVRNTMASDILASITPAPPINNAGLVSGANLVSLLSNELADDLANGQSPDRDMVGFPFHRLISFFMSAEYTLKLSVINLRTGLEVDASSSEVLQGDVLKVKLIGERADFIASALSRLVSDAHFEPLDNREGLIKVTHAGTFKIAFTPALDQLRDVIVLLTGQTPEYFQQPLEKLLERLTRTVTVQASSDRPTATNAVYPYRPFEGLKTARDVSTLLKTPGALTLKVDASHGLLKDHRDGPLRAIAITGPSRGSLSVHDDGSFEYTVNDSSLDDSLYAFINQGDEFLYALVGPSGMSDMRAVRIQPAPVPLLDLNMRVVDTSGKPITSIAIGQEFYLEVVAHSSKLYRVAPDKFEPFQPLQFNYQVDNAGARYVGSPITPASFQWERLSLGQENGKLKLNSEIVGPSFVADQLSIRATFDRYSLDLAETTLLRQKMVGTQAGPIRFSIDEALLNMESVGPEAIHVEGTVLELTSVSLATGLASNQLDVSGNDEVSPLDALLIINRLNAPSESEVPSASSQSLPAEAFDVNQDGEVTALDALLVINWLNTHTNTRNNLAEGETPALSNYPNGVDTTLADEQTTRRKKATGFMALAQN